MMTTMTTTISTDSAAKALVDLTQEISALKLTPTKALVDLTHEMSALKLTPTNTPISLSAEAARAAYDSSTTLLTANERVELIDRVRAWKIKHPKNTDLYQENRKHIIQFVDFEVPDGTSDVSTSLDAPNGAALTALYFGLNELILFVDRMIVPLLKDRCIQITPTKTRLGECGNNIYPKFSNGGEGGYQYVHRLAYALRDVITNARPFKSECEYVIYAMLTEFDTGSPKRRKECRKYISNYCEQQYAKWMGSGTVRKPEFSVDHINRDFFNASVSNLRLATREEQANNQERFEALRTKVIMSALV